MRFDIITIFPHLFDSFVSESLIAKAQKKKIIDVRVHNLRDWTTDKHHTVDGRPYGGGPGMILKFEPIFRALKSIAPIHPKLKLTPSLNPLPFVERTKVRGAKIIMLDPAGKQFDQRMAEKFSKLDRIVLLCGRYEGFDHRVTKFVDERISIGPYVLNGGEVPAMVIMEAVSRLRPGFVGKPESLIEETFGINYEITKLRNYENSRSRKFAISEFIEYPQYTRPEVVLWNKKKLSVPKILLSGHQKNIAGWRKKHSK